MLVVHLLMTLHIHLDRRMDYKHVLDNLYSGIIVPAMYDIDESPHHAARYFAVQFLLASIGTGVDDSFYFFKQII